MSRRLYVSRRRPWTGRFLNVGADAIRGSWIGWLAIAACGSAGAPGGGRPPAIPADEKAAVMRVARGLLDALWTGADPNDVPGAVLRNRKHMVGVTLRRNGVMLG